MTVSDESVTDPEAGQHHLGLAVHFRAGGPALDCVFDVLKFVRSRFYVPSQLPFPILSVLH